MDASPMEKHHSVDLGPTGLLTLDAGAGTDNVIVNGGAGADRIDITSTSISFGFGLIRYSNTESLSLDGGGESDALSISGAGITLISNQRLTSLNLDSTARLEVGARHGGDHHPAYRPVPGRDP